MSMMWIYLTAFSCSSFLAYFALRRLPLNKYVIGLMITTTILVGLKATASIIMPHYRAAHFESAIKQNSSLIRLLAHYSPAEFQSYVSAMKKSIIENGENDDIETLYTGQFVNFELTKFSQKASSASLYEFLRENIALDKQLQSVNPSYVLVQEFPNRFIKKMDGMFTQLKSNTFKNIVAAKEAIILSGLKDQKASPSFQEMLKANILFGSIISRLSEKYGILPVAATFNRPDDPKTNPTVSAEIMIGFYEAIYAQGETNAAILLKYLFKTTALSNSLRRPQGLTADKP